MAKSEVNKSQMIREALRANRKKSPSEIAEMLKEDGVNVTATYVSNVKFHSRHRRRSPAGRSLTVRGTARRTRRSKLAKSFSGIPAALEFIKIAGSLEAAKAALGTIEEIGNAVR
jgi:arginine repressor